MTRTQRHDVRPAAGQVAAGASTARLDQFARTPYAVSFARGTTRFTLTTLHVRYGTTPADRVPELTAIAQWLARWPASPDPWGQIWRSPARRGHLRSGYPPSSWGG